MTVSKVGIQVIGKVFEPVFFEMVESLCATQLVRLNEHIQELLDSIYPSGSMGETGFFLDDGEDH